MVWIWILIAIVGLLLYLSPVMSEGYKQLPNYLTKMPASYDRVSNIAASVPATADFRELSIADSQGVVARRTVTAPVGGDPIVTALEGFAGEPGAAGAPPTGTQPAGAPPTGTQPAGAPPTGAPPTSKQPTAAPSPASKSSSSSSSSNNPPIECRFKYNPYGIHIFSCDNNPVPPVKGVLPPVPDWLRSVSTRDGYDAEELEIIDYWLKQQNIQANPRDFLISVKNETLEYGYGYSSGGTSTGGYGTSGTRSGTRSGTTSGTTSGNTSGNTSTGKKCKPKKPKCPPKSNSNHTSHENELERRLHELQQKYQNELSKTADMGDYIRKDSIPCWACKI